MAFLTGGGVVLPLVLLNLPAELFVSDSRFVRFVTLVNRGAGEDAQRRKNGKQNLRLKESQHVLIPQGR
jgi:hypothetical protein